MMKQLQLERIHWITSAKLGLCPINGAHLVLECRRDDAKAKDWVATIVLHPSRN